MDEGEEEHTDVRMSILALDSNLNTILLRNLFRPTKGPVETVLALFFGHPLSSGPFRTIVISTETVFQPCPKIGA